MNTAQKKAQLIYSSGMEVQDIYKDLPDPTLVNKKDDVYTVCLWKLNGHFHAVDNVPYECHVFHQTECAPCKGKLPTNSWFVFISKLITANLVQLWTKDQLSEKLFHVKLKKKLLEINKITLEATMDKVWKYKASREQASQMVVPNQEPGAGTHVVEKI